MKKIEGFDLINEAGETKRLPAGIYKLQIKEVINVPEREYLDVHFDIIDGEFKGYYALSQRGFGSSVRSYKQSALPFFKAFITAVTKTNSGYVWNWDENTLAGKYVVGVFGEEEYVQDGEVRIGTKLFEFRSAEALREGKIKIPELRKLPDDQRPAAKVEESVPNTLDIIADSELPF